LRLIQVYGNSVFEDHFCFPDVGDIFQWVGGGHHQIDPFSLIDGCHPFQRAAKVRAIACGVAQKIMDSGRNIAIPVEIRLVEKTVKG